MSDFIKKYFIDILLLSSIWLFFYVNYFPPIIGGLELDLDLSLEGEDYSNQFKFIAIILFTVGIDIAVRRYFLEKSIEEISGLDLLDKKSSMGNNNTNLNLKYNLASKLDVFLGGSKRFLKFITKDGSFTLRERTEIPFNFFDWIMVSFFTISLPALFLEAITGSQSFVESGWPKSIAFIANILIFIWFFYELKSRVKKFKKYKSYRHYKILVISITGIFFLIIIPVIFSIYSAIRYLQ